MACVFFLWTKAYPCRQATASSVATVQLEKIIACLGNPSWASQCWGIHFICQGLWQVCAVWLILPLRSAYRPQVSGVAEHSGGTIKTQLEKYVDTIQISWPKALPLVLLNLSSTPLEPWTLTLWNSPRTSNALGPCLLWPRVSKRG